ncbi:uncharacterized protein [Drosophila bipectinata]|uniref:uncharacterized protein isoform X1 n=1 Tax=Drosophila bipectinata TaxID=42026 RepID=UPI001C894E95|nr:uncharacterized protein LOC108124546 [Drosophila bipectinata]
MARSECPKLLIVLTFWSCLLIGLAHNPETSACPYNATVEVIHRFFNQVLDFSIAEARKQMPHDQVAAFQPFFEELDSITLNEDYYSRAHYLFGWINADVILKKAPKKWLEELLPKEKEEINKFFRKVKSHLVKHLTETSQDIPEIIVNVTRWGNETDDSLIKSYWHFPLFLKEKLPELDLMNYLKMSIAIRDGEVTGIWQTLP